MISVQQHQSLNLMFILILGKFFLALQASWTSIFILIGAATFLEWLYSYKFHSNKKVSFSGLNASFGVIFMIKSALLWPVLVALVAGLFQKFAFKRILAQYNKRGHVFNPSNFAVMVAMLLLPGTYINSFQWGNHPAFTLILGSLVLFILYRVKRLVLFFSFIAFMFIVQYSFFSDVNYLMMLFFTSNAFLVFSGFMMTDPETTPRETQGILLFTATVSIVYAYLNTYLIPGPIWLFIALTIVNLFYAVRFFMNESALIKSRNIILILLITSFSYLYFSGDSVKDQRDLSSLSLEELL